jgi:hypothetical protein
MIDRRSLLLATLAGAVVPRSSFAQATGLRKLRSIVEPLPARQWTNIPGTALRSVLPPESKIPFEGRTTGPRSVLEAWNGCAYDPVNHDLYFWGGGHSDYGGNEVYRLSLESLSVARLTDPSPLPAPSAAVKCPSPTDGTPSSSHDYDGIAWCPMTNSFWVWPTIGYCPSGVGELWTVGQCWQFHPETRSWTREPDLPRSPGQQGGYFAACWVPSRNKFLIHSIGKARWFDPIAKTYSDWSGYAGWIAEGTSTYVAHRDEVWLLVQAGIYKIATGGSTPGEPKPVIGVADIPPGIPSLSGFAYDSANKMITLWGGAAEVWALDPDALVWRRLAGAAGAAPSGTSAVLSKWKFVAELGCFAGYTNLDQGLWVYKTADLRQVPAWTRPPSSFIVENADGSDRRAFDRFQPAAKALKDGQTLRILANPGDPWVDGAVITANGCTIAGEPGCKIKAVLIEGKACIVVKGSDTTIQGLEIFGAVGDGSANAIRLEGRNLTLRNCNFHHNEMALLTGNVDGGKILVEDCVFSDSVGGQSYAHNVYIGLAGEFIMRRSKSLRVNGLGHLVKSRALKTTIEYCVIAMMDGETSRCIDISDGGVVVIRNNVLHQGVNSDNDDFIAIAPELARNTSSIAPIATVALRDAAGNWVPANATGPDGAIQYQPDPIRVHSTLIEDNIFISDCTAYPHQSPPIAAVNSRSPAAVILRGNTLVSALAKTALTYPSPTRSIYDIDGSNKIVAGRAAAGYQPYPWLPPLPSGKG